MSGERKKANKRTHASEEYTGRRNTRAKHHAMMCTPNTQLIARQIIFPIINPARRVAIEHNLIYILFSSFDQSVSQLQQKLTHRASTSVANAKTELITSGEKEKENRVLPKKKYAKR